MNLAAEALAPTGAKLAGAKLGTGRQADREQAGNYKVLLPVRSRNIGSGCPEPLPGKQAQRQRATLHSTRRDTLTGRRTYFTGVMLC